MAKPLHSLQFELQKLRTQREKAEAEKKGLDDLIANTNKQIADFEGAINLLQNSKN